MIPSPLVFLVLALAALRSWQLAARDTVPPLPRLRAWAAGTKDGVEFRRPRLAAWLQCPWCSGLWLSAAWYGAWLLWPSGSIYPAVPLAISAAVGVAAAAFLP